jgi:tRNA A-37 threonylcarbamoyl transferase component Bud32
MTKRDDEDELARTATAAGDAASGDARPATTPLDAPTLGRYRLEHKLGEGGMGVVHAAFDPDLERRVALKVLRVDDRSGSNEARQRLLREARAMARLTHPNVVVVHEVGNAHGRDYVAMELIDGDALSEWLRGEKRAPDEILAAFLAAGRGLAAAHAANLVHRDFKPHNILRGKDGRVVVTDFGLARGVDALPRGKADAFETTIELRHAASSTSTPSSLSGLTVTGSVLGTPAYMAPEQWNAQTVGPAADQFAFCVALWEALVGERPYRADTVEQLKAAVERGPGALDASRLPRPLRTALRRGLDPDPAKRWPSMNALLARLARTPRPRLAIGLAAAAAAVAAVAIVVAVTRSRGGLAAPPCVPAARDVATVWSPLVRQRVAADRGELVKAIDANTAGWTTARAAACSAHDTEQLACLDGVLARTDAIIRAMATVSGRLSDQTAGMLVAPSVCAAKPPPRLTFTPSDDTVAALALYVGSHPGRTVADEAEAAAVAAKPGLDPCSRAIALLAVDQITTDIPRGKAATLEAITAADACGDDRLRADAILAEFLYEAEQPTVGPRGIAALQKASVAVKRVAQPDLVARIDETRASYAAQQGHWDEAFVAAQAAIDELADRPRAELRAVGVLDGLRFQRNAAGDMAAVRATIAKWRPVAIALHEDHLVDGLDQTDAYARLFLGDLASAHVDIDRLWRKHLHPPDASAPVFRGTVVDEHGAAVAGATVAVGSVIFVDAIGPLPFGSGPIDLRTAVTDAHGGYAIAGVPAKALIVAQTDARHRSEGMRAEPNMRLVLRATRRIAGNVALGGTPSTRTFVMATLANSPDPGRCVVMSPIAPDGSYALDGVTTAELKVGVATWGAAESTSIGFQLVPPGAADLPSLPLAISQSARTLDVIVRSRTSSPFESAQVFTLAGKHAFATVAEMSLNHHLLGMQVRWAQPIVGEAIPADARGLTRAGDLVAHFTDVRAGEISICVIGLNVDLADPVASRTINAHRDELVLSCVTPDPKAPAIVVEAPAQKRFDE